MFNPLSLIAPATVARRSAQKEAEKFAQTVRPGRTYYSVVDNHARYPGAPAQMLLEWTFSNRRGLISGQYMCEHMSASSVWLGYGPLHEARPHGLMTHKEWQQKPDVFEAEKATRRADFRPAGV